MKTKMAVPDTAMDIDRAGFCKTRRASIVGLERGLKKAIDAGEIRDAMGDCILSNFFAPKSEKYGCHTYGRQLFMPAGTAIVGKIHKHAHLNVILTGAAVVVTEEGRKEVRAPLVFVSEPGTKRAVYVTEDCTWLTVHLTESCEDINEIEREVIAESFDDLERFLLISEVAK